MATQRPRISGNRWLAALWRVFCLRSHAARRVGWGAQVVVLLFVFLFAVQGSLAPSTHAAPAQPASCPTSPSPGVGNCQGTAMTLAPPSLSPPSGGSIIWGGSWTTCAPLSWFVTYATATGQYGKYWQVIDYYRNLNAIREIWYGNWYVTLQATTGSLALINTASPVAPPPYNLTDTSNWPPVAGPWPPCPPPRPPCMTCLPQLGSVFSFNFFAYAPIASIAGGASCPAGSPAGAWCPPSVGNPVTLTVTGFHSALGPRGVTQCLGAVDGFQQVCLTLSWNLAQQVGPLVWNFDDEQVDPTTGVGRQSPPVASEVNQPVSHTFAYSSAFDPIRQCVRPCPGNLKGPPIPGYPAGTPAFQITLASNWNLLYTLFVRQFDGQTATTTYTVDLRRFGSPTSYFTSVTTLPLFVTSYGSVTS